MHKGMQFLHSIGGQSENTLDTIACAISVRLFKHTGFGGTNTQYENFSLSSCMNACMPVFISHLWEAILSFEVTILLTEMVHVSGRVSWLQLGFQSG